MSENNFLDVTELAGEEISSEQLYRMCNRYYWAGEFCRDRDVVEVACGTGPGLAYLNTIARSVKAGDFSYEIVDIARNHYQERISIDQFDAQNMPFDDNSIDVVIVHEALYYFPSVQKFLQECLRILRPGGQVLISNANKDLFDFNPSPHSFEYHGVTELSELFKSHGFSADFWGSVPLETVSIKQKMLRPIKKLFVSLNLMPKTMFGKRILKRLIFGKPVSMPTEISAGMSAVEIPQKISADYPNTSHKVIYCAASLSN